MKKPGPRKGARQGLVCWLFTCWGCLGKTRGLPLTVHPQIRSFFCVQVPENQGRNQLLPSRGFTSDRTMMCKVLWGRGGPAGLEMEGS